MDSLHTALTTYVILPSPEAADAVTLWIAASHAQPAWAHAPRLVIRGPEKRCGKSRLLDIVEATCHKVDDTSPRLRKALNTIITDVIGNRQTTMFMLAREHSDNPAIQSLFDLRLIHLISRGYSDKENPGLRYNIYSLDYGTYVDLKRTKAEPGRFLELPIDDEAQTTPDDATDRVVPFADKRSIRRVILTPTALTQ